MNAEFNVDSLIHNAEEAKHQADQRRNQQIAELKDRANLAVQETLNGAWVELAPYGQVERWEGDHTRLSILWAFCPEPLKLAPFYVYATANQSGTTLVQFRLHPDMGKVELSLPDFLHNRRLAFPDYMDEVRKERTAPLVEQLRRYSSLTRPQAQEIVKRLNDIWPDRKADWAQKHADWLDAYEDFQRREARDQLEREKHDREQKAFIADWEVYTRKYAEALDRNREKLAKLQTLLDTPYYVQKLTYALALEGEEAKYSTTREAFVIPAIGSNKHFAVIHRGHLEGRTFFTPVSLDDPVELLPTANHPTAGKVFIPPANDYLFYAPGLEDIQERIDALGLEPLPEKPAPPDWMDSYTIRQITGE